MSRQQAKSIIFWEMTGINNKDLKLMVLVSRRRGLKVKRIEAMTPFICNPKRIGICG